MIVPYRDDDFLSYKQRFRLAKGRDLTTIETESIYYWIRNYKENNLWTKVIASYPFIGGDGSTNSAAAFTLNIKNSFPLTNVNVTDAMCTTNGYQGNGITSCWDTGYNPVTQSMSTTSACLSFYCRTESLGSNVIDIGHYDGSARSLALYSRFNSSFNFTVFDCYDTSASGRTSDTTASSLGYKSGSRVSNILSSTYTRGILTNSNTATHTGTLINTNIILGAANFSGVNSNFSNRQYTNFSINSGYTESEELIRFKIQQTFENMLNRVV